MKRALLTALVAGACSGGPIATCPGDAGGNACVELRIASPVELVMGPQGGFHLDVGIAFGGVAPEGLIVAYEARDVATGGVLGESRLAVTASLLGRDGTLYLRTGDRIVLNVTSADQVVGRPLDVTVVLERGGVELGRDQARVSVADAR